MAAETAGLRGHPSAAAARRFGRAQAAKSGPGPASPDVPPLTARPGFHADAADTAEAITGVPVRRARRASSTAAPRSASPAGRRGKSTRGRARVGGRRVSMDDRPGAFERGGSVERAAVRQFRAVPRTLVVEWLLAVVIIALKPSEPSTDNLGTAGASESTIPQLFATALVFFLLAAVASVSPRAQKAANMFGGLVVLALLFKNHGSIAAAITTTATAKTGAAVNPFPSPSPADVLGQSVTAPGVPAQIQQAAEGALGAWRGVSAPQPTASGSASNPYPGGISGRA